MESGDLAQAEAVLSEAIEVARSTAQRSVELRAVLERSLARVWSDAQSWEMFITEVEAVMPELERLGDEASLAKGWRVVAHIHLMNVDGAAMRDALDRSIEYARRAGDRKQELDSLDWLLRNCWFGPRPVEDGIRLCSEALDYPERGVQAVATQVLGVLHGMRGDFERGRELIGDARTMQLELGMTMAVGAGTSMMGGQVELLAGDPQRAEELLRWGNDVLAPSGEKSFRSTIFGLLAEALYQQGRYDEAEEAAQEANELGIAEDLETQRLWKAVQGKVFARRGDFEQAVRLGRAAVTDADRSDSYARADARVDLAEILSLQGRGDEAAILLREAIALYEEKGMTAGVWRAHAALESANCA
jgi:tetratricopeptide (TPR) repeat protein